MLRRHIAFALSFLFALAACAPATAPSEPVALRVATYNIEDVRTADVANPDHPRLKEAARLLQELRPDLLLVNELTYDDPAMLEEGDAPGQNAQRFADNFLAVSQGDGLEPLAYRAYQPSSNTGVASGLDFDRSGQAVQDIPQLQAPQADGSAARQTAEERAYGGDAYGFGVYPGQYALAVFAREDLTIRESDVRTFQHFRWSQMPGALKPVEPGTSEGWYDEDAWNAFRLSSKTHADVPVRLPNGATLHLLVSHPTPPAFDGPEGRNKRRNHDEIRLWADYLSGANYLVDDAGEGGGLPEGAHFVIMGDLNADLDEGSSIDNPVQRFLLDHPRVDGTVVPVADTSITYEGRTLDADDTAAWGLRVDYVLPSVGLEVTGSGVVRPRQLSVSDHFPVYLDLVVPPPSEE